MEWVCQNLLADQDSQEAKNFVKLNFTSFFPYIYTHSIGQKILKSPGQKNS